MRAAVLLSAGICLSCRSEEQELIDRFFDASSRGDNEMVAALSMVAFPEEVTGWKVVEIGDEQREPYRIPAMRERVEEAEDRREEQFRSFGEFRQANYDELARIQRQLRDDPNLKLSGRLAELQRRWEAFRSEQRAVVATLREAEQDLEWEIRRVNKSLQREATPEYLSGETLRRKGRVRVSTRKGESFYLVTITRYALRNQFDAAVPTRWIVTEVAPESA